MTLTYDILLIIAVVMMVSAIITPLVNGFFRIPKSVRNAINDESQAKELQPVSIIITPHENAKELEANLPTFLSQDYPVEYEVIVVAWKGDSETEDILKRYKDHPRLYSTFIPETSRYMSRKKLAITLGVKAAKNEWLLITDIECTPLSDQWLKTMARNCSDGIDMVYGYTNYDEDMAASLKTSSIVMTVISALIIIVLFRTVGTFKENLIGNLLVILVAIVSALNIIRIIMYRMMLLERVRIFRNR